MLLELCFYLVKLRRAGGHHCHGTGNVARSEANCDCQRPKQGMRAPGATSQSLSELGQAQTHPLFLLIALRSCCGFTVKTVPVSTAKSSHARQQPGATASRQCTSNAMPFQASALRFHRENSASFPGEILKPHHPMRWLRPLIPGHASPGTGPAVSPRKLCEFPRRNPHAFSSMAKSAKTHTNHVMFATLFVVNITCDFIQPHVTA